jgi:hypothetical protein
VLFLLYSLRVAFWQSVTVQSCCLAMQAAAATATSASGRWANMCCWVIQPQCGLLYTLCMAVTAIAFVRMRLRQHKQ